MSAQGDRIDRISGLIHRELSGLLREVKDPRVPVLLTLREVRVTRDLGQATIYFSLLGDDDPQEVSAGLTRAAGFLRARLADLLELRRMPRLRFVHDPAAQRAEQVERLLAQGKRPPAADDGHEDDG